jgi:hypothetical protein
MQAFIEATLLASKDAQPQIKPFEISDNRLAGFTLRIQPSGVRSYYARFGRNLQRWALALHAVAGTVRPTSPPSGRGLLPANHGAARSTNHPVCLPPATTMGSLSAR